MHSTVILMQGPVAKPDIQGLGLLRFARNDIQTPFLSLRGAPIHRGDAAISTLATDHFAGLTSVVNRNKTQQRTRGVALLLVMVSVAAAVAIATALVSLASVKVLASKDLIDYAKADYLAESGMSEAAYFLANPPASVPAGYWTGATNRQLDASGSYYDVVVTQDAEDSTLYHAASTGHLVGPAGEIVSLALQRTFRIAEDMTTPIAHWKLDESSGTIAADSVGSNDGNLINMAGDEWTTGQIDGALEFDGNNTHISGIGQCPTGNYTIAGWAKDTGPTTGSNKWSVFYSAEQEIWFGVDRGASPRFWLDAGGNGHGANTAAGAWTRNVWHHIAATWDGTTVHVYLDGVDMPITIYGTPNDPQAKDAVIGAWSKIGTNGKAEEEWVGALDDVRIYDSALSAAEIARLANGE